MIKKYEEMDLLEKLDFWAAIYDIQLYLNSPASSVKVTKQDVKISFQHYPEPPSVAIGETINQLEKANPKAIREHNKRYNAQRRKEVD